jgi:hypothetical protein
MNKPRKMLEGSGVGVDKLMHLIETQSLTTVVQWTTDYAQKVFLPIYSKHFPFDERPANALFSAREWLNGSLKLSEAKLRFKPCLTAAQEADGYHAAQAAARAIYVAVATANTPTSSISIAYYGAAAVLYDRMGISQTPEVYIGLAEEVFNDEYTALMDIAVENEPNPVKVDWFC